MQYFNFDPYSLPREAEALRQEVREYLQEELADYPAVLRSRSWAGLDPDFSRKMGEKGWIGLTWPKKYGGHERTFLERYVVMEELLASGAPVAWHWIADRQSGNIILTGTQVPWPDAWTAALTARGPHPAKVLSGVELDVLSD